MVIDSSAIVAILWDEPERELFRRLLATTQRRLLSAASLVEAGIVIERGGQPAGAMDLDLLIFRAKIEVVPFDAEQAAAARSAWRRFGRGNHPAKLNLGDCFSYALAKVTGEPLLYKGADFGLTDITSAAGPESA